MERVFRKFARFEDADRADREQYSRLTAEERLSIMLDLIYPEGSDAASTRLERVYRIIKLGER